MPNFYRIAEIFVKEMEGSVSEEERLELEQMLSDSPGKKALYNNLGNRDWIGSALQSMDEVDVESALQKFKEEHGFAPPRIGLKSMALKVAAAIVIIIGITWLIVSENGTLSVATTSILPVDSTIPGKNKATLVLAGGPYIVLDARMKGTVFVRPESVLISKDSEVVYMPTGRKDLPQQFDKMITGIGEKYRVVLPDSTIVSLSPSSSIRYPSAFPGNERQVYVSGQAYFEVAKDKSKPFYVKVNSPSMQEGPVDIKVMGTRFNINAYDDEACITASVVEGSVTVITGKKSETLHAGARAKILKDGNINTVYAEANPLDSSYLKGIIVFNDDLPSIMQRLKRLYNIEPVPGKNYKPTGEKYWFMIYSNTTLAEVRRMLSRYNINTTLSGRKIIFQ